MIDIRSLTQRMEHPHCPFENAELTDKGVYTAKATNAVGEAEAKTTLNIAGVKPNITNDLEAALASDQR